MHLSERDFIEKLKLYFSSLFARRIKYILTCVPGLNRNEFLMSNIEPEEMEFYEQSAEYYLHKITFKSSEFVEDLFEAFPVFGNTVAIIDTGVFLSVLRKNKKDLSNVVLSTNNAELIISLKDDPDTSKVYGEIISEYLSEQYKALFDSNLVNRSEAISDKFPEMDESFKCTIVTLSTFLDRVCKCALFNNKSGVAIQEYPKKGKISTYTHKLLSVPNGTTAMVNCLFEDNDIEVISVQPGTVWFSMKKTIR